jgi:hypothetical protein
MKQRIKLMRCFMALFLVFSTLMVTACSGGNGSTSGAEEQSDLSSKDESLVSIDESIADTDDEYTLEKEEGHNQITFYWNYSGSYENCDLWAWWGDKPDRDICSTNVITVQK